MTGLCCDCRAELTDEEMTFLDGRCLACEAKWHARLQAWQRGAADAEFDEMFGHDGREPVH